MNQNSPYIDQDEEEKIPYHPWARLVYYLNKACLTEHNNKKRGDDSSTDEEGISDEQAAKDLLNRGEKIEIPRSMSSDRERVPYSIYPTRALKIIKSCVRFLEWRNDVNPIPTPQELTQIEGVICLTDQLFMHAVQTPFGNFDHHNIGPHKQIVIRAHAKQMKSQAEHLASYRSNLITLLTEENIPHNIPPLSCRVIVEEELKSSRKKYENILAQGFEGDQKDAIDSTDALQENKGYQATKSIFQSNEEDETPYDTEEENEAYPEIPDFVPTRGTQTSPVEEALLEPNSYPNHPRLNPSSSPPTETQRGNITSTPKNWIWSYAEDPLEFTLEYACNHANEAIGTALELLKAHEENPEFISQLGTNALIIKPQNKKHSDGFWRYLKILTKGFPPINQEHESTIEKLDCARFSLSLENLNNEWKTTHENLLIHKTLFENNRPSETAPKERPSLQELQSLLGDYKKWEKTWEENQKNPEFQTLLYTAYHGGEQLQKELHQHLVKRNILTPIHGSPINHTEFLINFHSKIGGLIDETNPTPTLRNELLLNTFMETKKADGSAWSPEEANIWLEHLQTRAVGTYESSFGTETLRRKTLKRLNTVFAEPHLYDFETLAEQMYQKLSGAQSQIVRRELRTQLTKLKNAAELRGDNPKTKSLQKFVEFINSISSQIKTHKWYENQIENKETLKKLFDTILKEPKTHKLFFPGSQTPKPEDPLGITFNFLKTYSEEKNHPIGGHTIKKEIAAIKETKTLEKGEKIQDALNQVSKTLDLSFNPTLKISQRKEALESALEITKAIHNSKNPRETMKRLSERAIRVVQYAAQPQNPPNLGEIDTISPWEIDSNIENMQAITEKLRTANNYKEQNVSLLKKAYDERNHGEALLAHAKFRDSDQENLLHDELQNLEKEIARTWKNNYLFWKGIATIGTSIKTRRDKEEFQISYTGTGTLKNILAITKAKSENRVAGLNQTQETPTQSPMFQIKHERASTIEIHITNPITCWLKNEVKGGKTKITQKEFEEHIEKRIDTYESLLKLSKETKNLDHVFREYKSLQSAHERRVNQKILQECLEFIEDPTELKNAIQCCHKNRETARKLLEDHPELDTPQKLARAMGNSQNKPKEIKKTTQKVKPSSTVQTTQLNPSNPAPRLPKATVDDEEDFDIIPR